MFTARMQGNVLDEDHLAVVFLEAYLQVTGPSSTLEKSTSGASATLRSPAA
jgi:hypothetical protein